MVCQVSGQSSSWLLGVFLSIVASICTNLGVNLQKYSFLLEGKVAKEEKRPYYRQPKWVFGMFLVVVGSIGDFAALGFAPQTLITPVGGFTMVANVFFAHYFLNESFNRRDAVATALIIGGVILVAMFADKASECFTLDELISFYTRTAFIIYAIFVALTCISLVYLVKHVQRLAASSGAYSIKYKPFKRIHPILYPALSGVFGAQSVLFAKSTAELIKTTGSGDNQFTNVGTYLIACSMVACIVLQIHWLAQGLQRFDAVFVVPIFQCFFITVSIIGGGVYFEEFHRLSIFQIMMFVLGVVVTLSGVFLLSKRPMNQLTPIQKLRAFAHSIIFIKRLQKMSGVDYRWVDDPEDITTKSSNDDSQHFDVKSVPDNYESEKLLSSSSSSSKTSSCLLKPHASDGSIDYEKADIYNQQESVPAQNSIFVESQA